jgi:hydrogenase/urease accessory protein HupE
MPLRAVLVVIVVAALRVAAIAHPLAPVLLELRELGGGRVGVTWKVPLLRPRGTAPAPALPAGCTALDAPTTVPEGTGLVTRWTAQCGNLVGAQIGIEGLTDPLAGVVRVAMDTGEVMQAVVTAGAPSLTVPERPRPWDIAGSYLRLGIGHILSGPDHLLFVLGLVLLAGTGRRVLGTVTAFTLGHSITLTLAVLGVTAVPVRPIELAIALSVLALAIELARDAAAGATLMRRHPWSMALVFGLLHGFGFAGALREAGLPAGDVPLALFAFNAGIEVGQIAFVAAVLVVGGLLLPLRPALPAWSRRGPVYSIGILAAFWCFERAAAWWG